jgi:hypothetical protein
MIRTYLGKSRVRESRTLGSVGATPNGLATRPSPAFVDKLPVRGPSLGWGVREDQREKMKRAAVCIRVAETLVASASFRVAYLSSGSSYLNWLGGGALCWRCS